MEEDRARAAEEAVDPDRLLDGEDPHTDRPDDLRMWASVYAELSGFKDELVSQTEARVQAMQPAAAREVAETDIPIMRAEADRLRRRRDYWAERVAELDSGR